MLALSMHSCIGNTGAAILFPSTSDILLVLRYRCILHQVLSKYCQVSKSTSSLMSGGNRIAQPSAEKAIRLTFTTHDFGTKADLSPSCKGCLLSRMFSPLTYVPWDDFLSWMKTTADFCMATRSVCCGERIDRLVRTASEGSSVRIAWCREMTGLRIQPLSTAGMSCFCSVFEALPIIISVS